MTVRLVGCATHQERVAGCLPCDLLSTLDPRDRTHLLDIRTEEILAVPRVMPTFDELLAGPQPEPVEVVEVVLDHRLPIVLAILANAELAAILVLLFAWWRS